MDYGLLIQKKAHLMVDGVSHVDIPGPKGRAISMGREVALVENIHSSLVPVVLVLDREMTQLLDWDPVLQPRQRSPVAQLSWGFLMPSNMILGSSF